MRILDRRQDRQGRPPSIHCDELNCHRATHDGKPYCSEHVIKNEYIAAIIKSLKQQERNRKRREARQAK
jgi:hypothetical protein